MRSFFRAFAAFAICTALGLAGIGLWLRAQFADTSLPANPTLVVVPNGASGGSIAALLERAGVVRSAVAFEVLARVHGEQNAMRAGAFRFAPHERARDVLAQLTGGGAPFATWVTVPEGFTNAQIAETLAAHGFGSATALRTTFARGSLTFDERPTPSLEGYLFPETYLVPHGASPNRIASLMTAEFQRRLPPDAFSSARALGMTIPQIVTLASLVEREAKADDERALMAGVYYNRLRRGMTLDVDATIEYTFPSHHDVITLRDLRNDSPYNTYRRAGLPPTPICNPGLPSLLAALHPKASDYLYYVYAGNGRSVFSRTLAEQNANAARYLR